MGYRYRELICPYCNHRFMLRTDPHGLSICEFVSKKTGKLVCSDICPTCGSLKKFASEDSIMGLREDEVITRGISSM